MKKMNIPFEKISGENTTISFKELYKNFNGSSSLYLKNNPDKNEPTLLGFFIPPFQRPEVWTIEQKQRFIESCFLGFDIGRIVVSTSIDNPKTDGWLIDGQQRLSAIRDFFDNQFSIFNNIYFHDIYNNNVQYEEGLYLYKKNNEVLQEKPLQHLNRLFFTITELNDTNPDILEVLYHRLNYGGTNHIPLENEEERMKL